jgi:hypothetical protein
VSIFNNGSLNLSLITISIVFFLSNFTEASCMWMFDFRTNKGFVVYRELRILSLKWSYLLSFYTITTDHISWTLKGNHVTGIAIRLSLHNLCNDVPSHIFYGIQILILVTIQNIHKFINQEQPGHTFRFVCIKISHSL